MQPGAGPTARSLFVLLSCARVVIILRADVFILRADLPCITPLCYIARYLARYLCAIVQTNVLICCAAAVLSCAVLCVLVHELVTILRGCGSILRDIARLLRGIFFDGI